jgi:lipid-A-disaccharide synthase
MPQPLNSAGDKIIPVFISAGDPSGDIAGGHLLKNLKPYSDKLRFFGLGGCRMRSEGQEQLVDSSELAVMGFWEVARRFRFFRNLLNRTIDEIRKRKSRVAILIDYPGFNLRLAERLKSLGIPVIYYISPQIWAWGGKRIDKIKQVVDLMLLILPFEKEIYDRVRIKNQFVGHYLFDDINPEYIKAPYNINSNLIALLPGSRPQEIEKMLPVLVKAAGILCRDRKWRFAVGAIEGAADYRAFLRHSEVPIELVTGKPRELIADSRLVIVSSGTATLETGIIGRPMVVIYKTGWLTYNIARRLVKLDKIALINIAAGEKIVPELIQHDAGAENIVRQARRILEDDNLSVNMVKELNRTADSLGTPGAGQRAASLISEYFNC